MPVERRTDLAAAARSLAAPVERVFAELSPLAEGFADAIRSAQDESRRAIAADLAPISSIADSILGGDGLLVGAGVVLEPGLLDDVDRYLEWRQLGLDGRPRPLLLDVDPGSEDPYDYPEMEWFRVPRDESRRMVGGPYFDYRGADRFALTFALPVVVDGAFVGVAGADVPLAQLEAELLPVLRRIPVRAALVNHESRVVTANTPHYATGERVRPTEGSAATAVVPDLGWDLLTST